MTGGSLRHPQLELLAALKAFHQAAGDVFQVQIPRFRMVVMAGPEPARSMYVTDRDKFLWRGEGDAVVRLLRHGVLIVDGQRHDHLRELMDPALYRRNLGMYVPTMHRFTEQVAFGWRDGAEVDMLVEMRRIALLILVETLFGVDLTPDLERLWQPILKAIAYISPGGWLLWPGMPRPGYDQPLRELDEFLYAIVRERRARPDPERVHDVLGRLISTPGLDDDLIRDQLLTMLIAGHDTSTALLAWTFYLLGSHPQAMERVRDEVDAVLGSDDPGLDNVRSLTYLDLVIREALRLYPPIHASMRKAAMDVVVLTSNGSYKIPEGSRVLFSIYLTHRHPAYWDRADDFIPERFAIAPPGERQQQERTAFTYLPFGAGPRNCIGAAYGKLEAQIILAKLFQHFDFTLTQQHVHPHMGATLEPRPGVRMTVRHRRQNGQPSLWFSGTRS